MKLQGGMTNKLDGRDAIWRNLERLENLAGRKLMWFGKGKCTVLHLGWNSPTPDKSLGMGWTQKAASQGRTRESRWACKLNRSQQCALAAKAGRIPGCVARPQPAQ